MSVKFKKSSNKAAAKAVDRPFDRDVLQRAEDLARGYQIILHMADGEYYGRVLEMPWVMNDGKTPDECVKKTRDILTTTLATMIENGEDPPAAASEEKRTEQINVRLTCEEKLRLEETARSRGFRGVSDYVRTAAISASKS